MKFRTVTVPDAPTGVRHGHVNGKPEWLREWLANQGRYVMLTCGHKEDLNDSALLIIYVFGKHGKGTDILCEQCNKFVGVKAKWKQPPKQVIPNEPMF